MPVVPIETPSETAIVLNSIGVAPASRMPRLTSCASSRWLRLHGIVSIQVVRDPDDRLGEVLVGEAGALQHRARAGAIRPVGEFGADALGGIGRLVVRGRSRCRVSCLDGVAVPAAPLAERAGIQARVVAAREDRVVCSETQAVTPDPQ